MKLSVSGLIIIMSIMNPVYLAYGNDVNEDTNKALNERLDFLFGKGASKRYQSYLRAFEKDVDKNTTITLNERLDYHFGEGASKRYEPFIRAFRDAVQQNDPVKISTFIQYPISIEFDNEKIELHSTKDFIKYYSRIFTPQMRATVMNTAYEDLFSNWQGVMFGHGAVWIAEIFPDPKSDETFLKVTTIHMNGVE